MKKFLKFLACAMGVAAFSASADPLLYWMVDQGDEPIAFEIARVAYSTDGGSTAAGYLTLVDENGTTADAMAAIGGGTYDTKATWADLSGMTGSGYSFYVELLSYQNSDWAQMGRSDAMSYDNLLSAGHIAANALSIGTTALTAWTPTQNVPEPTSGMLLLVGGALLALRRRRTVA